MSYTKEEIQENLRTDTRWMERAVLVLFERQTSDEQQDLDTHHLNGIGFNGTDAKYLSWVATYLQRGHHLSGHHIAKVAKKLPKYWKQILDEIEKKETETA